MQQRLATHWKPFMNDTAIGMQDATCYESRISFPTDVKLVWNCCKEVYLLIQQKRKELKLRKGRMNYADRKKDFTDFQKTKKKARRTEKKVRKKLLKFLFRLLQHITEPDEKYQLTFSNKQAKRYSTIVKIYGQQHEKLYGNVKEIKDRVVSLSKPYIRPIIRGKETKVVEFGAKVNMLQIDGINFIGNEKNQICIYFRIIAKMPITIAHSVRLIISFLSIFFINNITIIVSAKSIPKIP